MNHIYLDHLVKSGVLKSYRYENLDSDGNIVASRFRNTEQVILEFQTGDRLVVSTFCSGSSENAYLQFSNEE